MASSRTVPKAVLRWIRAKAVLPFLREWPALNIVCLGGYQPELARRGVNQKDYLTTTD